MPTPDTTIPDDRALTWVVECCHVEPWAHEPERALAAALNAWERAHDLSCSTPATLARCLTALGCRRIGDGDTARWIGIEVRTGADDHGAASLDFSRKQMERLLAGRAWTLAPHRTRLQDPTEATGHPDAIPSARREFSYLCVE